MAIPEVFEKALRSATPCDALRAIAIGLFAQAKNDQTVYDYFEAVRAELRLEDRESDEDLVMDVMDCLTGWCNPQAELKSSPPGRVCGQEMGRFHSENIE